MSSRLRSSTQRRQLVGLSTTCLCLVALNGCGKSQAPTAPNFDGPLAPLTGGSTQGSSVAGDAGSGADGGVPAPGCIDLTAPIDANNSASVSGSGSADSFAVTRAYAFWDTSRCGRPTVLIGLSDGSCEIGSGQRLVIAIKGAALDNNLLSNVVDSSRIEDNVIVDYVAPATASTPSERAWSSCGSGNSPGPVGALSFNSAPSTSAGALFEGDLSVSLDDCVNTPGLPQIAVVASFRVVLAQSLQDACNR